jgi:hypothetical protein
MKLLKSSLVLILILIFACFRVDAQSLQLADIYTVYTLDSLTLQRFATFKNFELKKVENYGGGMSYDFNSLDDSTVTFVRWFAKSDRYDRGIFLFNNDQYWRAIKDSLKADGFKHDLRWEAEMKDVKHGPGIREKFNNSKYEVGISIGNTLLGKTKYYIFIIKRQPDTK